LPFDKLKAPSRAEGLKVHPEPRFPPALKGGASRGRMGEKVVCDKGHWLAIEKPGLFNLGLLAPSI